MPYDPRTIAFAAEILHPPQQVRADLVQTVHNTLYRQPGFGYQSFQVAPDGVHLTNLPQAPGQVSAVSFAWDRLVVREELRASTVEDFAARVVHVATLAFQTLGIGASLLQQFVVRSLVAPRNFRDGRNFLGQRLIAPGASAWQAIDRPMQSLGVRLVFPAHQQQRASHQIRIETWPADARSIWLENTSSTAAPLAVGDFAQLGQQLDAAYRFLTGPVADFLGALDTP